MNTDLFQSCGHCWVFQVCWHIECSTFTASSFTIWNSSTGIPSPPLALFVVMLPKAHLTLHSRMSGSRWVITHTHHCYLNHEDIFCIVLLCIVEITHPYKIYWQPHILLSLGFQDGPHSVYRVCISLNKTFALLWLALEFIRARSQEPTFGGHPKDLPETRDMNILSTPWSLSCNSCL